MALEEGESVSEVQIAFDHVDGHSHDGEDSTKIDFSGYNILDIINYDRLRDIIVNTVNHSTIRPNQIEVGFSDGTIRIDGSAPSGVTGLTASSSASTTSDGNIFIDVSWAGSNTSVSKYIVELHKSETGISGVYIIMRTHETTALSHRFEGIDNNSGDGGSIYYKTVVYAISPVGVRSVASSTSGIAPATNTTPPGNTVFNDSYTAFDEGVKATFKGMFVYLNDNTEFDVKDLRGRYEYQVSVSKTSFDTADNLKASGVSKSTYFIINNLDVRASAGGSKIDYYLRVRSINSSGTTSSWVYYKNTADGGSSGAGTTTASAASAINLVEIVGIIDIQVDSVDTAQIAADAITADEVAANAVTANAILDGAVQTLKLADDAVTAAKVAAAAIGTVAIDNDAITAAKVATGAIGTTEIADDAITTAKIIAGAVQAGEIAADAITADKIAANAVTADAIAANSVTASEIAADTITASQIAAGAINTSELAADAVTANEIAANAVTADSILANAITTAKIAAGAVSADEIAANAISAVKIQAGAVTANEIEAGAITATEIAADAIEANHIATNAVTADSILAGEITATEIAADAITTTKIFSGAVTAEELGSIAVKVGRYIQSTTFTSGSVGWKILADGSAEFSNVTVRGVVVANTGTIGGAANGWVIASNVIQSGTGASAVHINSGGGGIPYIRMGAKTAYDNANSGVWLDPTNGLVLGSGTSGAWIKTDGKFYLGGTGGALQWDGSTLTIDGNGTFSGALSAATGSFVGSMTAGSISINSGRFNVDSSGNVTAKSINLGSASAPTSYNNSMVMGGASAQKIYISSTPYEQTSVIDLTALEWRDQTTFSTKRAVIEGGVLSGGSSSGTYGLRLSAGSSADNWIRVNSGAGTEGVYLWANESGTNKIKLYAGGVIELYANSGVLITATSASKSANHLVNDGGVLYWGTNALSVDSGIDWTVDQGSTNIHTGNYTNTTYSVGDGGLTQNNFTNADHSKLDGIADNANNYVHATYDSDDISVDTGALSGATVISDLDFHIYSNSLGHVTDAHVTTVSTRELTLANLGYTGATNANNYSHPTGNGNIHIPSDGATGQILRWSGTAGTAAWGADNNTDTTYSALSNGGLGLSSTEFYILWTNTGTGFGGTYATNLLYEGGFGVTYKTDISTVVETGLGAGLTLAGSATINYYTLFTGSALKYYTSREATKDHITTVVNVDSLTRVNALRPVNFYFNDKIEPENEMARLQKQRGFIAEELAAVDNNYASWGWLDDDGVPLEDPEAVGKDLDDAVPVAFQLHSILADAVGAIQALSTKLEAAEARLAALEA